MKALRERKDIVILPADKGRCTVVMNKDVYNGKIMTLLENETTYRKLKKDPTATAENRMNAMLLSLKNKGIWLRDCTDNCVRQEDRYCCSMVFPKSVRPGPH